MENFKKGQEIDREIVFSKTVKAGKRIYYVDVKRNRKGDLFIALTESKKIVTNDAPIPTFTFEKHKIFLYQEDLDKFMAALNDAIKYLKKENPNKQSDFPNDENSAVEQDTTISFDDIC